jgi:hypothetical protein
LKTLWWAALALIAPVKGLAADCPPYSVGVHQHQNVLISVASAEILNIEDPASVDIAKAEAKIRARKQLTKEKSTIIQGAVDISTCQIGEFIYASVTMTKATREQASRLTNEMTRSIENQPTPKPHH